MVDGVRGDAVKIGNVPLNEGDVGAAAAQSAKQTPAGALSLQPLTSVSSPVPLGANEKTPEQAAARAQGAPVPLRAPAPDALTSSRVMQTMRAIADGADDGGAAVSEIDVGQLMLVMFEMSRALRDTSMKQRAMSQEANIASQTAAISTMREAAVQRFASAIVESTVQLGMAALSFSQAATTAKAAVTAERAKSDYVGVKHLLKPNEGDAASLIGPMRPGRADVDAMKVSFKAAQADVDRLSGHHDNIQKMGAALGKAGASAATFAADESSIAQRHHELDASRHDAAANSAAEMANVMRDRANETLQALRSIHQSMADASSAVNRNM